MISILRQRRSIRKFQPFQIPESTIDLLKEAALRSPTSRNRMSWEFIFVTQPEMIQHLSESKQQGSAFLADAPLAIVICGNPDISDVWIEDCSIAAIILQLTGQELGLGSCWIQIRKRMHDEKSTSEDFIRKRLNIPEHMKVESIIALGYPDEQKKGRKIEKTDYSKIKDKHY